MIVVLRVLEQLCERRRSEKSPLRVAFSVDISVDCGNRRRALVYVLKVRDSAKKYAERRGVRLGVRSAEDVRNVEKLAIIKIANWLFLMKTAHNQSATLYASRPTFSASCEHGQIRDTLRSNSEKQFNNRPWTLLEQRKTCDL
jgi:hypothetical protein